MGYALQGGGGRSQHEPEGRENITTMSKILSIILYLCIFAAGVVVAILSANNSQIVMWLGIVIAGFTLWAGLLTTRDIADLQKKAENAVYFGETIGTVPVIDINTLKEQIKKDYPELNP